MHASRRKGVDPDPAVRPIGGEIAGQAEEARFDDGVRDRLDGLELLGHAVTAVDPLIGRDDGQIRGDVENDPPAAAGHLDTEHLRAEKRPGQAHREVGVPALDGERLQPREVLEVVFGLGIVGGVVDENVDAAEPLQHLVSKSRNLVRACDVRAHTEGGNLPPRGELRRSLASLLLAQIRDHGYPSEAGHRFPVLRAKKSRPSRDDHDAIGQIEHSPALHHAVPPLVSPITLPVSTESRAARAMRRL